MNIAELKQIIIAAIILICITIMGCLRIVEGESIVWVIGMVAGYVFGIANNNVDKKNNNKNK